jgi:hypothetical protein
MIRFKLVQRVAESLIYNLGEELLEKYHERC